MIALVAIVFNRCAHALVATNPAGGPAGPFDIKIGHPRAAAFRGVGKLRTERMSLIRAS